MKTPRNRFPGDGIFFVIGILVLCILGVGIYFVASYVVNVINGMDEEVARIFNAGLVFILFAAIIGSFFVAWVQRTAHERLSRAERAEVYARFLETLAKALQNAEPADAEKTRQLENKLRAAETHLLLLANSKVIEQYMDFRQEVAETGLDDPRTEQLIEEIVAAMRKDLSRSEPRLNEGEVADLLLGRSNLTQQTTHGAGSPSDTPA